MNKKLGFIPWEIAWMNFVEDSELDVPLRTAFFYYEKLIFPTTQEHLNNVIKSLAKATSINEKYLLKNLISLESLANGLGYDGDKVISYFYNPNLKDCFSEKTGKARKGMKMAIDRDIAESFSLSRNKLKKFKTESPQAYIRESNAKLVTSITSVSVWSAINEKKECAFVGWHESEKAAFKVLLNNIGFHSTKNILSNFEIIVPSIEELKWNEIYQIREEKEAKRFREWMWDKNLHLDSTSKSDLEKEINIGLWDLVQKVKPNLNAEIIEGVLSNLPLPSPINPFSVYGSTKSIDKANNLKKEFDWLFFIHRLKKLKTKPN